MNWEDERYVRLYVRDTGDWCALSWDAQALLMHLFRKADRSGIVQLGKRGRANLPAMLGHGNETARIDSALSELVLDGCVELRGDNLLVIPNFTKAQEAKQSDRRRQEESRGKRLAEAMAQPVSTATSVSHAVTRGHDSSHDVTPSVLSVPSYPAVPSIQEELRSSFAGGSSPTRPVVETGRTSEPQSPRTPAPVQGSRPEQDGLPGLVLAATQKPSRNAPKAAKEPSATAETWDAYSSAYKQRYGNPPARNAKINGQLAQLVAQLGADEAPIVAAFYLTHPAAIYNFHPVGLLLRDCQALRTQWMRGSVVTPTAARRNEETAANPALALLLEQRRKKNGNG